MGRGTEIELETGAALCQHTITQKQPEYVEPRASLLMISSREALIRSREMGIQKEISG